MAQGPSLVEDEKSQKMMSELVWLAAKSIAEGMTGPTLLRELWFNPNGYDKHVEKRIELGHVENAEDYASKTFKVLAMPAR